MYNFVIDIGNTFCKIAVFENDNLIDILKINNPEREAITSFFAPYTEVKHGIYSDVRGDFDPTHWDFNSKITWHRLHSKLKMPFENHYQTPQTLGSDRLALAAAASKLFPSHPTLVISAGTCITLDFVNEKQQYLGGSISPGIQMRLDAMHQFTGKLPQLTTTELKDKPKWLGFTTENSLYAGAIQGAAGELDSFIRHYQSLWPDLKIILTGGDYLILDELILSSIFARPNLVLIGMNYILDLNV